jgi:hypothetical protein
MWLQILKKSFFFLVFIYLLCAPFYQHTEASNFKIEDQKWDFLWKLYCFLRHEKCVWMQKKIHEGKSEKEENLQPKYSDWHRHSASLL